MTLFLKAAVMFPQVMVNTACCILMLIAKGIQCIVFGPLRVSEKQVTLGLIYEEHTVAHDHKSSNSNIKKLNIVYIYFF